MNPLVWESEYTLRCGDVTLDLQRNLAATGGRGDGIRVFKTPAVVQRLVAALDDFDARRMMEIGVLDGGSAVLFDFLFDLERLVGIDTKQRAPQLERYIALQERSDRITMHFGQPQDDAEALQRIHREDFEGAALDFVADDASHQLRETRITFEACFPMLRPGGIYMIEDWSWGHHANWPKEWWLDRPTMATLVHELVLLCASRKGIVDDMHIDPDFVLVRRGSASIESGSFRIADHLVLREPIIRLGAE